MVGFASLWFRESTPVQTDGTSGLADAGAKPKRLAWRGAWATMEAGKHNDRHPAL